MGLKANTYCPYCNKEIVVEQIDSESFPLGMVKVHKREKDKG